VRVFNTLSRSLEQFEPFEPPLVKMYVCGPTVYDETHVGHGRTFVVFDSFRRYLELRGYTVIHVQNITDIDDKIIKRAREEKVDWRELADKYASAYLDVLKRLDAVPMIHPRVTDHIDDIQRIIALLIERGHAYSAGGSVYFDVSTYPDYGRLSKTPRESWRQEEEFISEKRNPADFALWKRAKPGEPYWESPWGPGRPGWHIECTAMSTRYLGTKIDIHAGGADLIFPHHENERAQSECAFGSSPWVKYWLHSGMVTIRGEKMSKSLGNIVNLKDLLSKYDPGALRLWYLSAHYRAPLDFNEEALQQYSRVKERLENSLETAERVVNSYRVEHKLSDSQVKALRELSDAIVGFYSSMDNDFDTPNALRFVHEATGVFWRSMQERESYSLALAYYNFMERVNSVFRFSLKRVQAVSKLEEDLVKVIVEVRKRLREQKLFQLADEIRERLREVGVVLYDRGLETEYRFERRE